MVDDDDLDGAFVRLQPQAELLLDGSENGRTAEVQRRDAGRREVAMAGVVSSGTKSSWTSKSPVKPLLSITVRPSTVESTRTNSGIGICPPCIRAPEGANITLTLPHRGEGG